ncbi:MAG: hypothetical protein P8P49_12685 [Opitutales bacterium]|nr:hypothetical protein [Opitutales bacterium]
MDTNRRSHSSSDPSIPAAHDFRVAVSGNSATARSLKDDHTSPLLRSHSTKLVQTNVFFNGSTLGLSARPIFPEGLFPKNGCLFSYTALLKKLKSH